MSEISDRLEIKVIAGRNLLSVDSQAPSAYVEVVSGQDSKRTKQITESRDPVWNSPMMTFTQLVLGNISTIQVTVKHKDVFTGRDTCLGVAFLHMSTFFNSPKVEIDDWYDLTETTTMTGEAQGSIRIIGTYFNKLDDVVNMAASDALVKPPNSLQVHYYSCRLTVALQYSTKVLLT